MNIFFQGQEFSLLNVSSFGMLRSRLSLIQLRSVCRTSLVSWMVSLGDLPSYSLMQSRTCCWLLMLSKKQEKPVSKQGALSRYGKWELPDTTMFLPPFILKLSHCDSRKTYHCVSCSCLHALGCNISQAALANTFWELL